MIVVIGLGARTTFPATSFLQETEKPGCHMFLRNPTAITMVCRDQCHVYKACGIRHC